MDYKTILDDSRVEEYKNGYMLSLPKYEIADYDDFKKQILHIGGKSKTGKGFFFDKNPKEKLQYLKDGKLDYKKKNDFYPTPFEVCEKIATTIHLWNGIKILEPSAGQGAFIQALLYQISDLWISDVVIHYCEIDYNTQEYIDDIIKEGLAECEKKGLEIKIEKISEDFLLIENQYYDLIIANPPFKDADNHLRKIISCLDNSVVGGCSEITVILPLSYAIPGTYVGGWKAGDGQYKESEKLLKILLSEKFTFYTNIYELDKKTFKKSMANVSTAVFYISAIANDECVTTENNIPDEKSKQEEAQVIINVTDKQKIERNAIKEKTQLSLF